MNKPGCLYIFFAIFAIAGLACGAWGVAGLISRNRILNEGIKTTGTIVELARSSKGNSVAPVVAFRDQDGDSVVYRSNFYSGISDYQIGQQMVVRYLPSNPKEDVVIEGMGWTAFFPFIFLLTHGGVGIGGIIWLERKRRRQKWLLQQGQEVKAHLVKVNTHWGKSGRKTYTLTCEWTDRLTGQTYTFESESIPSDPADWVARQDDSVRVLIDPANPKRYWVDVSHQA